MNEAHSPPNSRRAALLAVAAAFPAAGFGAFFWRRHGLTARLFNPLSADRFDLPALPGLLDGQDAPVPGLSAENIAGKAVFLNAFASWCPQCRSEHAALMECARDGAAIFGIASLDDPLHALEFLRKEGNPFARVGVDRDGYLYRALGARGVPASFVLAPAPHIVLKVEGPLDAGQMRARILPLLES